MKRKLFLSLLTVVLFFTGCDNTADSCPEGEVRDLRFRTLPQDTFGMCISEKESEDEKWCSGKIEDGECLSEVSAGEECRVLADCGEDADICLGDPMVLDNMKSEVDIDEGTSALITSENLRNMGLSICTVTECDKKDEDVCPNETTCQNVFKKLGMEDMELFICMKDEAPDDTGNTGDTGDTGNTGNTGDTGNTGNTGNTGEESDIACLGDDCSEHADCKVEGCEATFCTAGLAEKGFTEISACAYRCDPENENADCEDAGLEGFECTDVQPASMLGVELDGAKGICAPPEDE
ncbi:MAG: hypothetical protein R6W70_02300 [bacterium]